MVIEYSARSHVGRVRDSNEDNLYVNGEFMPLQARNRPFAIDGVAEAPCVFAVCDGMGGEDCGEMASYIAVEEISRFQNQLCAATGEKLNTVVHDYVQEADMAIRWMAGPGRNAGTTLALVVITNRKVHCFNIGDSRIYAIKNGLFQQITNDHTWMAERMQSTRPLTNDVLRDNLHKITRCIGIGPAAASDSYPAITGKCRLLMCSDGMTDMVSNKELEEILAHSGPVPNAADALLSLALGKGGYDNTTLIVLDIVSPRHKNMRKLLC